MNKKHIAVIFGGTSGEREISIKSATGVLDGLDKEKYEISSYDFPNDLEKFLDEYKNIDVVLPILHGQFGEDGTIQGFFETLGIKYAFSGVYGNAIAMNKKATKTILKNEGILVPEEYTFDNLKFPLVIKPNRDGSSLGVYIVKDQKEFDEKIKEAQKISDDIIFEQYIKGREFTSAIFGNKNPEALPILEIKSKNTFFDYESKYTAGMAEEVFLDESELELEKKIQAIGLKVHLALELKGVSRTDVIADEKGDIYFLEVNTIPGQTGTSLVPQAAQKAGYSYSEFLDKIIELALE
ncbi:MAG: D-alanine--D-alanine ligase [Patescibacteria group bacterium]|nr:D-alanine--D-alanine ligase [Patescibacteria group bacterium]